MNKVEYRGYTKYEIDSLTNSGQAAAMGHGSGREGAYKWIDAWYDVHGFTLKGVKHPKPDNKEYMQILESNERSYQMRRAADLAEAAARAEYDKYH